MEQSAPPFSLYILYFLYIRPFIASATNQIESNFFYLHLFSFYFSILQVFYNGPAAAAREWTADAVLNGSRTFFYGAAATQADKAAE